ncbi:YitT family protein [Bacillus sp. 1P06AnD]|uniref:YitT family protein n=1 Tax=Bacillus sp. 1P06AnD TaxID=3132208 RepID=UPI0039A152C9
MSLNPFFSQKQIWVTDLTYIIIGNIAMSFAYAKWMVPHEIINGGVTSLSLIFHHLSTFSIVFLNNSIMILLLLVSLFFLGKENFVKSIIGSCFYLFFFSLFFHIKADLTTNLFLDMALSSVFIAFGYYCCISRNASTVGMDIIALILHKKNPGVNIAATIRLINIIVLAVGFIVFGWKSIVVGIIFTFLYSWLLGYFMKKQHASNSSKKAAI